MRGFNWSVVKPLSGLMPFVTSPPLVKPGPWSEGLLGLESSGQKSFAFLWEGQLLKEYGAITTWGSVFLNPTLKPSHTH